jgi:hypothetical protein
MVVTKKKPLFTDRVWTFTDLADYVRENNKFIYELRKYQKSSTYVVYLQKMGKIKKT